MVTPTRAMTAAPAASVTATKSQSLGRAGEIKWNTTPMTANRRAIGKINP